MATLRRLCIVEGRYPNLGSMQFNILITHADKQNFLIRLLGGSMTKTAILSAMWRFRSEAFPVRIEHQFTGDREGFSTVRILLGKKLLDEFIFSNGRFNEAETFLHGYLRGIHATLRGEQLHAKLETKQTTTENTRSCCAAGAAGNKWIQAGGVEWKRCRSTGAQP